VDGIADGPGAADDCPGPAGDVAGDCPGPAAGVGGDCPPMAAADGGSNPGPGPHGGGDDGPEVEHHPDGSVSEVLHISRTLVGKLIGKGGATIMGLQTSTGVSIQVDQHTATRGGECRRVTLKGAPEAVAAARAQVQAVLDADPAGPAPAAGETSLDVNCPPTVVGRIIGRAGETIKLLQAASGAYILVNQNFPEGQDRVITVSGSIEATERASNMIRDLIANDQVSVQAVIQKVRRGGGTGGNHGGGTDLITIKPTSLLSAAP
jgi:rRNA processing protein Krr1/Pno1